MAWNYVRYWRPSRRQLQLVDETHSMVMAQIGEATLG